MASVDGTNCLACGEPVLKRARVAAATVSSLLKKSCSKVYLKHLEKDEHLYEATSASVSVLASQQSNSEIPATRKRLASQESALHGATKRQCIIQDSAPECISPESPPIVVGIGYKSGYQLYPVTSPTRKNVVLKHIEHHQYSNMSKKSETVPLGIIFRMKMLLKT
uniref:Uncharacterized protein n=1 Tax=Amphimedon queenslandica TaxID=400682 RepID=A0A1X7T9M6_AMPQE